MNTNAFLLPEDQYQRAIDPINDYLSQSSLYISKMFGIPRDIALKQLVEKIHGKEIPFTDPNVVHFERMENEDKEKRVTPHTVYYADALKEQQIIAPTGTTYLNVHHERSLIAVYLDENVLVRSKLKKLSQQYEQDGNQDLYLYNHNGQDAAKRDNNAVSGSFVAEGSIAQNRSAHSTLTSTTRSMSSLSNASNERLIEGNRHYYNFQVTLNNLISICDKTDNDLVARVVSAHGLVYPTIEDTLACIKRSTDLYWRDRKAHQHFKAFIEKCSPTERAAIVYTGDLYHIRLLNDEFTRRLIRGFSARGTATPIDGVEDPVKYIWSQNEAVVNYAHQICLSLVAGIGKDYSKIPVETQWIVAKTCWNIVETINDYKDFFKAFFLTLNSPCTIATIPNMIRRSVVLSDTDSTMFSVDNWLLWYKGEISFTDEDFAIAGAVAFIATQAIAHVIAILSANLGVERKRLFLLAMKPEFVFPVFALTSVKKHYYTAMKVKEGNVYKDIKMEIKGVHLKDSSIPVTIIKSATQIMEDVIRTVMRGEKIELTQKLQQTIAMEQEIAHSISASETTYLKRTKVKESSAYKLGAQAEPWYQYLLWQQVFAKRYGQAPKPPYNALRLPLTIDSGTKMKDWLESLDIEFRTDLLNWMQSLNKKILSNLVVPTDNIVMNGIPLELKPVLDVNKLILTLTKSYRNVLESLGYFCKTDQTVMSQFTMRPK